MEWTNPVSSASVDVDQDPMSSFAQALFGGDTVSDSNGDGSSVASSAKETSSTHVPNTVDVAQALFGDDSGAAGVFGENGRSGLGGASRSTGNTFDVEESSQTRTKGKTKGKRAKKEPSSNTLGVEKSLPREEKKEKKGHENQRSSTFDVEESSERTVKKGKNGTKGKTQNDKGKKKSKTEAKKGKRAKKGKKGNDKNGK
jgi:hypothetical protein